MLTLSMTQSLGNLNMLLMWMVFGVQCSVIGTPSVCFRNYLDVPSLDLQLRSMSWLSRSGAHFNLLPAVARCSAKPELDRQTRAMFDKLFLVSGEMPSWLQYQNQIQTC